MEELGTMGRIFGALISKAGIPIPTEITPKVLSAAQHISKGGIISEGIFNFLFQPPKSEPNHCPVPHFSNKSKHLSESTVVIR